MAAQIPGTNWCVLSIFVAVLSRSKRTSLYPRQTILFPGKTNRRGRLSTVGLLIEVACFVKEVNNMINKKAADLN